MLMKLLLLLQRCGINLDSKSSRKSIQFDGATVFNIEEIVDPAVGAGFHMIPILMEIRLKLS